MRVAALVAQLAAAWCGVEFTHLCSEKCVGSSELLDFVRKRTLGIVTVAITENLFAHPSFRQNWFLLEL